MPRNKYSILHYERDFTPSNISSVYYVACLN